jgi:hypothetical protein
MIRPGRRRRMRRTGQSSPRTGVEPRDGLREPGVTQAKYARVGIRTGLLLRGDTQPGERSGNDETSCGTEHAAVSHDARIQGRP